MSLTKLLFLLLLNSHLGERSCPLQIWMTSESYIDLPLSKLLRTFNVMAADNFEDHIWNQLTSLVIRPSKIHPGTMVPMGVLSVAQINRWFRDGRQTDNNKNTF